MPMKILYCEGHHVKKGYIVSLEYTDAPPVRFYQRHPNYVKRVIERFNRIQLKKSVDSRFRVL